MKLQNITSIEIIVTESCNLKCKYCFQDKRKVLIWRGFFEVIA